MLFDRKKIKFKPLSERKNKISITEDHIPISQKSLNTSDKFIYTLNQVSEKIKNARKENASVILAFGAHTIKNGLGPVIIKLIEEGWITHLATNGAGIIHDWEFAFQGKSSENVRENVSRGEFGIWEETGFYLNLALVVGAYRHMGYGESIGSFIFHDGIDIPKISDLRAIVMEKYILDPESAASALDLLHIIQQFHIKSGWMKVEHPYKKYSVQAAAFGLAIPFTGHPMFGQDIIYTHPLNFGAAIGRTAQRDFLSYANSVSHIENGVYLSVGSAVMSPMIFEKSLSMSQNLYIQQGKKIKDHYMLVVDLAEDSWNWNEEGEPLSDNPAYYLRYCKTFSRMGGQMSYLSADNRDFLLALCHSLCSL
jgi:hypothetical protein